MESELDDRIKLFKNTKGYNWEICLYVKGNQEAEDLLPRIKELDDKLVKEYGSILSEE